MLFHRFILGELVTNCYLIADENTKNAVLFDAPADSEKVLDYLDKNDLNLKIILLTHAHFDHILALKEIMDKTGAKCMLHKDEEKYLSDPALNLSGEHADKVGKIHEYSLLDDGERIVLDGLLIETIHTPGHTAGGACYLVNGEILISGDTLFSGSIGRTDFPLGSFDDEIKSIKEKLMPLGDEIKVYPGHGFSTTIGKQRKENPYLI
ncbi:MAG: MBL fold metallo-hydrolase [Clostridia bacterium]|nr:MBL fold metallo-hydrolase [Clostridia bacterium]